MARKTSFYYSFFVLPADQRRAIIAVWDFCRAVDDAVDEPEAASLLPGASLETAAQGLAFWREELARAFSCSVQSPPLTRQGRNLQPFVTKYDLPRAAFEDVIDG